MTTDVERRSACLDLADLGMAEGGGLLLRRGLRLEPEVQVSGSHPSLEVDLRSWCRHHGHHIARMAEGYRIRRRSEEDSLKLERAGSANQASANAPQNWGIAARGARVEAGGPAWRFAIRERHGVQDTDAKRIYRQALAAQWNPERDIDWSAPLSHSRELEEALVNILTYLIENENAAWLLAARMLSRMHPHYRETMQVLSSIVSDEARHAEVFARRAGLRNVPLGVSTVGGQSSLYSLFEESDFSLQGLLLGVLGEGSFLEILWFLHKHAPDPITRQIMKLAAQDEARHVAFGLLHLEQRCSEQPGTLESLELAIVRRHESLARSAGLNPEVYEGLALLAAGSLDLAALRHGHQSVIALVREMETGRAARLQRIGFSARQAAQLAALHTKNFM